MKKSPPNVASLLLAALLCFTLLLAPDVRLAAESGGAEAAPASNGVGAILIPMEKTSLDWVRADDTEIIRLVNQLLEAGVPVKWALEDFSVGGGSYPAGTFYIETPFTTESGLTDETIYDWLQWEGKNHHVYTIKKENEAVSANAKDLVMPQVVLFYDDTTYENCLQHYNKMRDMGFKVQLASAMEIAATDWNDPASPLASANVFAMPGGAMHFYSFWDEESRLKGIENIKAFVENGGGYVGVCAGSTEALVKSAYPQLQLVDANYHNEWFEYEDMTQGDWDWRGLIGPVYLEVTDDANPVMFGYGENARRPGYGPLTTMYYYGGPAMWDIGEEVDVLANYAAPVTQKTTDKIADVWGSAAIVTQQFGEGHAVLFGPHPEWPGPCERMYAQALYYTASNEVDSPFEPAYPDVFPDAVDPARVETIVRTVREIKPYLEDTTRMASEIVNLRAGDHYHPLGLWYDESIMVYGEEMYEQLNEIQAFAQKFEYEYRKLALLREKTDDAVLLGQIDYAMAAIDAFFASTEAFAPDAHMVPEVDWSGAGPFEPFTPEMEPQNFEGLTEVFRYIRDDVANSGLPYAYEYAELFNEYEAARVAYEKEGTEEAKAKMDEIYLAFMSYEPVGYLSIGMGYMQHTLNVMQYKADKPLLHILAVADRAEEVLGMTEYAVAGQVGSMGYASACAGAFTTNPVGGLLL